VAGAPDRRGGAPEGDGETWTPDERVFELERRGAVTGYVPVLDPERFGIETVIVRVRAPEADTEALVADYGDRVTDAFELTGSTDLLLVVRFRDHAAVDRFLAALTTDDRVERVNANLVHRTVCEHDSLPLVD
jgi:DNA-binding Lrp family transcriptional regulator